MLRFDVHYAGEIDHFAGARIHHETRGRLCYVEYLGRERLAA
jgi:hypothetical protein